MLRKFTVQLKSKAKEKRAKPARGETLTCKRASPSASEKTFHVSNWGRGFVGPLASKAASLASEPPMLGQPGSSEERLTGGAMRRRTS